jgi:hypothetical protein
MTGQKRLRPPVLQCPVIAAAVLMRKHMLVGGSPGVCGRGFSGGRERRLADAVVSGPGEQSAPRIRVHAASPLDHTIGGFVVAREGVKHARAVWETH